MMKDNNECWVVWEQIAKGEKEWVRGEQGDGRGRHKENTKVNIKMERHRGNRFRKGSVEEPRLA